MARLVEVDLASGTETTRITFDSNDFPAANVYQVRDARLGECNRRFDFVSKAYYIEATLSLTGNLIVVGNAAGIEVIKIGNTPCRDERPRRAWRRAMEQVVRQTQGTQLDHLRNVYPARGT